MKIQNAQIALKLDTHVAETLAECGTIRLFQGARIRVPPSLPPRDPLGWGPLPQGPPGWGGGGQ